MSSEDVESFRSADGDSEEIPEEEREGQRQDTGQRNPYKSDRSTVQIGRGLQTRDEDSDIEPAAVPGGGAGNPSEQAQIKTDQWAMAIEDRRGDEQDRSRSSKTTLR